MLVSVINIDEVLEGTLDQENGLDENDWYFLHYQCQVLYQVITCTQERVLG